MSTSEQAPKKKSTRSPDFRYFPCDAINLGISENGVKILFGVDEFDGITQELVGIHMTHKTAMLLKSALAQGLDHYQTTSGVTLDEPKVDPE